MQMSFPASLIIPIHLTCQLVCPSISGSDNYTVVLQKSDLGLPDNYTPFADIGLAYAYIRKKVNWDTARKYCIADGGNMAVIDSIEKINYLNSLANHPQWGGTWVGIHKLAGDDEWLNIKTGLPVKHVPWAVLTHTWAEENTCLVAWDNGKGLFAQPCTQLRYIVCEIPLKGNSNKSK